MLTQPSGLVGYTLFLLFGHLANVKKRDERRWLPRVSVGMAVVALMGGLILAHIETQKLNAPSSPMDRAPAQQQINQVQQTTAGQGSPSVQGVQGDVTVTVDQSTGGTKPQKPTAKKAD